MAKTKKPKLAFSFGIGVVSILLSIFLGKDLGTLWVLGLVAVSSFVYGVWHLPWVEKEKSHGEIATWMGRGMFLTIIVIVAGFIGGNAVWQLSRPTANDRGPQGGHDEPVVDPPLIASDAAVLPHVDLTKRALIKAATGTAYFCRPGGAGITEVHIMVSLVDLGIATSLGGWRLQYESSRMKQSFRFIEIDDHDKCNDSTGAFKFNRANSIYEQTDKRIEPNTKYRGWVRFQVPGFLYKELGTRDVQLTIEFGDSQGKKYTVTYIGNGNTSEAPMYYPGVPSPITTSDPGSADVVWCTPEPIEHIPWGFTTGFCNLGPAMAKQFDAFVSERAVGPTDLRNKKFRIQEQKGFLALAHKVLTIDQRPADVDAGHNRRGRNIARPIDVPEIQAGTKIVVLRGYVHWNDSVGFHETYVCEWLKPTSLPPKAGIVDKLAWSDCELF